MARLNTSVPPSSSLRGSRATSTATDNSLYRVTPPTVSRNNRRGPPPGAADSPVAGSDKENQSVMESDEEEDSTPKPRGKRSMAPPSRPQRNGAQAGRQPLSANLGEYNIPAASQIDDPTIPVDDLIDLQYYDPDQNPEKRRKLRHNLRENARLIIDNKDELMQAGNTKLLDHIKNANKLMAEVRQTSDATIDSRFLINAGELTLKRAQEINKGDVGNKIDTDEFVSKCITFMRNGGPLAPDQEPVNTQARRQRRSGSESDDDDDENDGEGMNWACLGALACFPTNRRPAVPGFLLGPLSVEKKVRLTQRRATQRRTQAQETRPDELKSQDLQKAENTNLTSLCRDIRERLKTHINTNVAAVEEDGIENMEEDEQSEVLRSKRIAITMEQEAAVSLFDFAINPKSFGQTVENLFYISFLIRDGNARIVFDSDGLPLLSPAEPSTREEKRKNDISRHQAIFSIDEETWKMLIRAFDIKKPLIPHREEEAQNLTANGWYAG